MPAKRGYGSRGRVRWSAPRLPTWKTRRCPRCEAAPGHSCKTWKTSMYRGDGVGQWVLMKTPHAERRGDP